MLSYVIMQNEPNFRISKPALTPAMTKHCDKNHLILRPSNEPDPTCSLARTRSTGNSSLRLGHSHPPGRPPAPTPASRPQPQSANPRLLSVLEAWWLCFLKERTQFPPPIASITTTITSTYIKIRCPARRKTNPMRKGGLKCLANPANRP